MDKWETRLKELDLYDRRIVDDMAFNVLGLACIDAYRDCIPMPEFFEQLLHIYEAGNLPCGWKGRSDTGNFLYY